MILIFLFTTPVFFCLNVGAQDSTDLRFYNRYDLLYQTPTEPKTMDIQSIQSNFLHNGYWAPNENGGILPEQILYLPAQDQYLIYGKRRILVMNQQYTITNAIDISDHGNALPQARPFLQDYIDDRIALNTLTNLEVYCATNELVLKTIDLSNYSVSCETESNIQNLYLAFSFIRFNQSTNQVYWIVNGFDSYSNDFRSFFIVVDCETHLIDTIIEYEDGFLIDLLIHPSQELYYLSYYKPTQDNVNNLSQVKIMDFDHNDKFTIYLGQYDELTPYDFIHHFDFIDSPVLGEQIFCYTWGDNDWSNLFSSIIYLDASNYYNYSLKQIGAGGISCSSQ